MNLNRADEDLLSEVNDTINEGNDPIPTSFLFKQLRELNHLSEGEIGIVNDCKLMVEDRSRRSKDGIILKYYSPEAMKKLKQIYENKNFYVLSSNFEGIIKSNNLAIYEEASKKYPKKQAIEGNICRSGN